MQVDHQLVEAGRGDRIQPGRRLVQKQQRGIERQRPRQRGALDHAAGELRRQLRAGVERQADHAQAQLRQRLERRVRSVEVLADRQLHVLGDGQRAEQRAVLERHAVAALDGEQFRIAHLRDVLALDST